MGMTWGYLPGQALYFKLVFRLLSCNDRPKAMVLPGHVLDPLVLEGI